MKKREKYSIIVLGVLAVIFLLSYGIVPLFTKDVYDPNVVKAQSAQSPGTTTVATNVPDVPGVEHLGTPSQVRAIYMSQCVVGTKDFRQRLVDIVDTTEINALVIDIKDYTGQISFTPDDPTLKPYVSDTCGATDMQDFVTYLHQKNIYVIGRLTTFQDPYFSKLHPEAALKSKTTGEIWKDKNGLAFLDPGSQEARDHVVAIAIAAHNIGFDEINFDYTRYPSDGNVSDIALPKSAETNSKAKVIEDFWQYLHSKLKPEGIVMSADLFGLTTSNYDDLGIGQVLERAMPYFDYIDPMVYPSHYPATFNGWKNPNAVPGPLITYVMQSAIKREEATSSKIDTIGSKAIASTSPQMYTKDAYPIAQMRPWLQDFTLGQPVYTATDVRAQIDAAEKLGLNSWLLWNASNKYTVDALNKQ